MFQFETTFSEIIRRTPDIKSFRFDVHGRAGVAYKAGQYFFVTIKVGNEDGIHHFTISSSPGETAAGGYLEFTKRITSSDYSQALDKKQPGDWAHLRGPEGDFTLPRRPRPLAFLSGGIGITPLRSMLRHIVDKDLDFDVVLLYGNNTYDNIAFRDELDEMAKTHPNIRVEYVLSGPDFPADWPGKRGYITSQLVTEVIPDFRDRLFYLSGPLKMVLSLEEQLEAAGVPDRQVKRDYFPGYD